jgi:hypothetical protein
MSAPLTLSLDGSDGTCTTVQLRIEPPMELTLGVRVLMSELERLAKEKGFEHSRVDAKVNVRGELVVAVLIPPRTANEWGPAPRLDSREAKRRAREQRS